MGTNLVFPLITFPYVARVLGPAGIGEAQFAFTYAQYFSLLATIGIPYYGIKEIAMSRKNPEKLNKTFSELFATGMLATFLATVLYSISIALVPQFRSNISLYLISGSILVFAFLNLDWLYNGLENFKFVALRSVLIKLLALLALFFLVKRPEDLQIYLAILAFSFIGNFFLNAFFFKQHVRLVFCKLNIKRHLAPLLLILSSSFATTIYSTLDSVTLGLISTKAEVGLYAASVKLAKVSIPLVTSLSAVLIPRIAGAIESQSLNEERNILRKSFSFIVFLSIPIAFGLFIYSENMVLLFSGSAFSEAATSLKCMACLPVLIGLGYFFGFQILVPRGRNKQLLYSTFSGLTIFLSINWFMTPQLGSLGTAIATLSTEFVVTLLYLIFSPKEVRSYLPWSEFLRAIMICLCFFPIRLVLSNFFSNANLELLAGILISSLVYFILQRSLFKNPFVLAGIGIIKSKIALLK